MKKVSKKIIIMTALAIVALTSLSVHAESVNCNKVAENKVTISAPIETYRISGKIIDGKMLLPAYQFGQLGFGVEWNNSTKELALSTKTQKMVMGRGHYKLLNGRVYFSLGYIRKFDGVQVAFDSSTKIATVTIERERLIAPDVEPKTYHFEREPLPEVGKKYHDEYRDVAWRGRVYFEYEKIDKYGMVRYTDEELSMIRIKSDYDFRSYASNDRVTVRTAMEIFADMLDLEATSNPLNIPQNIQIGSRDYRTLERVAKTGIFKRLPDRYGYLDMDRAITWPELNQASVQFLNYMGAEIISMPVHDAGYLTIVNNRELSRDDFYNITTLLRVGLNPGEIDNRSRQISIYQGDVRAWQFRDYLDALTLR